MQYNQDKPTSTSTSTNASTSVNVSTNASAVAPVRAATDCPDAGDTAVNCHELKILLSL